MVLYVSDEYEGVRCLDKAIEFDPNDAITWNSKGLALVFLNRYEEAVECYDRALEINPDFGLARINKQKAIDKLKEKKVSSKGD
jgi:tetratricopeptide (TPR) repeat protein